MKEGSERRREIEEGWGSKKERGVGGEAKRDRRRMGE